jgi:mRNA interferase MazF
MTTETLQIHAGDIVLTPFPFTDRPVVKKRPTVVVSNAAYHKATGHFIGVMVTTAENSDWALDVPITNLQAAGLKHACVIRPKLFTLDSRVVLRVIGRLDDADQAALRKNLSACLDLF